MRFIFYFIFLICFPVNICTAAPLTDLIKKAGKGDAQAQYELGMQYYHGTGPPRNIEKALHWLEQAGKNNHADALFELGTLYEYGEVVAKDIKKAKYYYDAARSLGHSGAWIALEKFKTPASRGKKNREIFSEQETSIHHPEKKISIDPKYHGTYRLALFADAKRYFMLADWNILTISEKGFDGYFRIPAKEFTKSGIHRSEQYFASDTFSVVLRMDTWDVLYLTLIDIRANEVIHRGLYWEESAFKNVSTINRTMYRIDQFDSVEKYWWDIYPDGMPKLEPPPVKTLHYSK